MAPSRVHIERILCPTDFSEFTTRALRRAVGLGRWFGARVTALHVIPPSPWVMDAVYTPEMPVSAELLRDRRAREEKELARCIEPLLDEGAPIEIRIAEGEPWCEIQAAAAALPADLLVMGTHGRSGFQHLLLGSVTEKVLRRAPCPVLTVGATDTPSSPGPLFHRILCATDLTEASQGAVDLALSLAEENLGRVTLLHVVEGLLGEAGPEIYRPIPEVAPFRSALVHEARERLHGAAAVGRTFCEVNERVETGKAWRTIVATAQEMYADLIVVGAHVHGGVGRLLLGSTADQVVRHAFCPVLVVREALAHRAASVDLADAHAIQGTPVARRALRPPS